MCVHIYAPKSYQKLQNTLNSQKVSSEGKLCLHMYNSNKLL